jgi:hypothetical protein
MFILDSKEYFTMLSWLLPTFFGAGMSDSTARDIPFMSETPQSLTVIRTRWRRTNAFGKNVFVIFVARISCWESE